MEELDLFEDIGGQKVIEIYTFAMIDDEETYEQHRDSIEALAAEMSQDLFKSLKKSFSEKEIKVFKAVTEHMTNGAVMAASEIKEFVDKQTGGVDE